MKLKLYREAYGLPLLIAFYILLLIEAPVKIVMLIGLTFVDAVIGAFEEVKDGTYRWHEWIFGLKLNPFHIKSKLSQKRDKWRNENLIIRGEPHA